MKTINKEKGREKLLSAIKTFLEKENIKGKAILLEDEELKGALSIKVESTNINTVEQALRKTKELNKKLAKLFPDKYITITIIPS